MEEEFVLSDFLKQKMEENIIRLKNLKYEEKEKQEEEIEENLNNNQIDKKSKKKFSRKMEDLKIVIEKKEDSFSVSENESLSEKEEENGNNILKPDTILKEKENLPIKNDTLKLIQISDENLRKMCGMEKAKEENIQVLCDRPNCEYDLSGSPITTLNTKLIMKNILENTEMFLEELIDGSFRIRIGNDIFPLGFFQNIFSENYKIIHIDKKTLSYEILGDSPEFFIVDEFYDED